LHERHKREGATIQKVLRLARAARRPVSRPAVTHDRPSSTRQREGGARMAIASGRDGTGERDDGSGDGDGGGGSSEPPPPRLITVARCDRDRDPFAGRRS
jgi:hypothetical protein